MLSPSNARYNSEESLINWSNQNAMAQRSTSVPRMYGCMATLPTSAHLNIENTIAVQSAEWVATAKHCANVGGNITSTRKRNENEGSSASDHPRYSSNSNTGGNIAHQHYHHHPCTSNRYSLTGVVGGSSGAVHLSQTRLEPYATATTVGSSLLGESMTEIVVEDLRSPHEPTSELLDYCKRKFLRPFIIVLSVVGVNPIPTDTSTCLTCLNYFQALLVLMILMFGYFLQYLCSYRGDRGFIAHDQDLTTDPNSNATYTIGQLLFGHIFPNALHLCGSITAVIVFKILDQEQLQNLVERVFLTTLEPRRLCKVLWLHLLCGLSLLALLFAYTIPSVLLQSRIIQVRWFTGVLADWEICTKVALIAALFVQDLVEVLILTNYCIQCYLLRIHISSLSHKLLMHSIETIDWMREVLEFHKLLGHLNRRAAVPVCFLTIMNLAYAFAGLIYVFNDLDFHYSALEIIILNIFNVLLWLVLGLIPFVLAASVTHACQKAQSNGHHIRVRPFVYHSTSSNDLNSTLLFSSSLQMSAKLFKMPIQPNYLCCALLSISIIVLTLGMCLNPSIISIF